MKQISINGTTVLVNMDKVCAIAENYIQFDGGHVIWGEVDKTQFQHTKHGHWIEANDISSSPFDAMKRCLCSECREWGVVTNYCPNCGAKMDETPNIPRHNGKSMMELERLIGEVEEDG